MTDLRATGTGAASPPQVGAALVDDARPASCLPSTPSTSWPRSQSSPRATKAALVDLSVGTPCDPPPAEVLEALATSGDRARLPVVSSGSAECREAALGLDVAPLRGRHLGARPSPPASGPRSSSSGVPHWLRLRDPARDTVLCPVLAYPTYEMGAHPRPVPGRRGADWDRTGRMDLSAISPEDAATGTLPVGQQPWQSRGSARGPRGRGALGSGTRGAGLLGRVLHRVHLGRARHGRSSSTAPRASSPCTRCRSGRTSPGCGPVSSPGTPISSGTSSKLRQHAGFMVPGPGPARRRGRPRRRRARRAATGEVPRAARRRFAEVLADERDRGAGSRKGSFYLWVAVPERVAARRRLEHRPRRLGAYAVARREGAAFSSPRVTPTVRRERAMSESPSCSPTIAWSSSRKGSRRTTIGS